MPGDAIRAFAEAHELEPIENEVRAVTPMLITGAKGTASATASGELAPGLEGRLIDHHFVDGATRRRSTILLTAVSESAAFVPALVCRDRQGMGGTAPAQLPAERWTEIELESEAFSRRYRLLTLVGQDAGFVRELFSPALISWLAEEAPPGLSFELNQGHLAVGLPGGLEETGRGGTLTTAAAELARRLREEAGEEEFDPDLFDESAKVAAVERVLGEVSFDRPPASAAEAVDAYRAVAARKPTVLLAATLWALLGAAAAGALAWFLIGPFAGVVAAVAVGAGAFPLARLVYAARYHWGAVSVSRVGLEAFVRQYASSRGLELHDRWRLLRTVAGSDRFRARVGELMREVIARG